MPQSHTLIFLVWLVTAELPAGFFSHHITVLRYLYDVQASIQPEVGVKLN